MQAVAEGPLMQTLQRQAHQRQLAMALGALREQHLFLVGEDRLVGDIQGIIRNCLTALRCDVQDGLFELLLMTAKMIFELHKLVVVVIGLAGHDR